MRILKKKIASAEQFRKEHEREKYQDMPRPTREKYSLRNRSNHHNSMEGNGWIFPSSKGPATCKNVMKNYSRAFVNFAISDLATPYLTEFLQEEAFNIDAFRKILNEQKEKINCIKNLRELLLVNEDDTSEILAFKAAFKSICEVFIKYFSVNWIYNSKVGDKRAHLSYRFKILRRVQQPEYFTYLESFKGESTSKKRK